MTRVIAIIKSESVKGLHVYCGDPVVDFWMPPSLVEYRLDLGAAFLAALGMRPTAILDVPEWLLQTHSVQLSWEDKEVNTGRKSLVGRERSVSRITRVILGLNGWMK